MIRSNHSTFYTDEGEPIETFSDTDVVISGVTGCKVSPENETTNLSTWYIFDDVDIGMLEPSMLDLLEVPCDRNTTIHIAM